MNRRRRSRGVLHPSAVVALAFLAAMLLLTAAIRLLPWLIAAAVVAVAVRWLTKRSHTAAPRALNAADLEMIRLRAELDQARAELADAREAMHAAWDAAANVPPRTTTASTSDDELTRLLAAPFSGARRLGDRRGRRSLSH